MKSQIVALTGAFPLLLALSLQAEVQVTANRNEGSEATPAFKFKQVPPPSKNDAAQPATFTIIDGRRDNNGGALAVLHDGQLPGEEDAPADNFFFGQGTDGGRIVVDLGKAIDVKQVNTYSWHGSTRGPQVYKLYASDGKANGFNAKPGKDAALESAGWKLLTNVDTRPKTGEAGGQYGVSISDSTGSLGKFQYFLFAISQTEDKDPFGNTFYSEIDIVDRDGPAPEPITSGPAGATEPIRQVIEADGGKYKITIDTTETPDLTEWAQKEIAPMVQEWYPKLGKVLASDGFTLPPRFSITFSKNMSGVAATGGTRVRCAAKWVRQNLKGEAKGAIFHEMVHVVQQYGRSRVPGWLTEGLTDYMRFYVFEPQTHGADISTRNVARARYDASYRVTANFLNWVTKKQGEDFVPKLNALIRQGKYSEDTWKDMTGQTVQDLATAWKADLEKTAGTASQSTTTPSASAAADKINVLTDQEKQAGWQLLFNGQNFDGWHNFKREGVRPGWQVKDGVLVCADPHNAGDIVTSNQFRWFELELDYNISEAGNSGIMYRVTEQGGAAWATGPEFQLEDNVKAQDPVRCGWLYALYQPPIDPKTGKTLDATKPVGEWNHVRLVISPEKCEHIINGVKYFDYVLGSDDFKQRVAKSKFASMKLFAKADKGSIALQGDHGQVSFRNIKIRPLDKAE